MIAIGLVALAAGQLLVPQVLVPALELVSGLLVLGLGARLVWRRWRTLRRGTDTRMSTRTRTTIRTPRRPSACGCATSR